MNKKRLERDRIIFFPTDAVPSSTPSKKLPRKVPRKSSKKTFKRPFKKSYKKGSRREHLKAYVKAYARRYKKKDKYKRSSSRKDGKASPVFRVTRARRKLSQEEKEARIFVTLRHEFPVILGEKEPPAKIKKVVKTVKPVSLAMMLRLIDQTDIKLSDTFTMIIEEIENYFRSKVLVHFWEHFVPDIAYTKQEGFDAVFEAVDELYKSVTLDILPSLDKLQLLITKYSSLLELIPTDGIFPWFLKMLQQMMISHMQTTTELPFYRFIEAGYVASCPAKAKSEETDCESCPSKMMCEELGNKFISAVGMMFKLDIFEMLCTQSVTKFIVNIIKERAMKIFDKVYEESNLSMYGQWIDDTLLPFLKYIHQPIPEELIPKPQLDRIKTHFHGLGRKLYKIAQEIYTRILIAQAFNIIVVYPESQLAMDDLRLLVQATKMYAELIKAIKHELKYRLFHQGVTTPDILTAYINTVRTLKDIDPSGEVFEQIITPYKKYLKTREDTIHCIILYLTEDEPNELIADLLRGESAKLNSEEEDKEAVIRWPTWKPSKSRFLNTDNSDENGDDLIAMLIAIFGSKQLFIDEYRKLLADRFLTHFSFNTDREIRYLEMLKVRFGEYELLKCEIMLRDVYESVRLGVRLNAEIAAKRLEIPFYIRGLVLSEQYWPPFKANTMVLPEEIQKHFDTYSKAFEEVKTNRTLRWKPYLGLVNIDVIVGNTVLNFNVSPCHAIMIWHFQTKSIWNVQDLSAEMKVLPSLIRSKILYWQTQGLIKEVEKDVYEVVEEPRADNILPDESLDISTYDDDEEGSAIDTNRVLTNEDMELLWSYVVGMLTNLESLSLDRIHAMLDMFVGDKSSKASISKHNLKILLDTKIKGHQLVLRGDLYSLLK